MMLDAPVGTTSSRHEFSMSRSTTLPTIHRCNSAVCDWWSSMLHCSALIVSFSVTTPRLTTRLNSKGNLLEVFRKGSFAMVYGTRSFFTFKICIPFSNTSPLILAAGWPGSKLFLQGFYETSMEEMNGKLTSGTRAVCYYAR